VVALEVRDEEGEGILVQRGQQHRKHTEVPHAGIADDRSQPFARGVLGVSPGWRRERERRQPCPVHEHRAGAHRERDAPAETAQGHQDQQQRPAQVADRAEDELPRHLGRYLFAGHVYQRDIGRIAHRARCTPEHEGCDHHHDPTRRDRVARERDGEAECAAACDHAPAAVVGEHGEDVARNRAGCGRDEHDARLGVRQAEIGAEGLERAVREKPRELVHETDGEQRDDEGTGGADECGPAPHPVRSIVRSASHRRQRTRCSAHVGWK
jgi:hypothetical protein